MECQSVCPKSYNTEKAEDKAKLEFLKKGMLLNYQHHWWGSRSVSLGAET